MNSTKYYLFIVLGLLALILTFFIKVRTPVGIYNEYFLISKIKWDDEILEGWYVYSYVCTYYLVKIGIIMALLVPPKRVIIVIILLFFILSIISNYLIFSSDSKLVSATYIPYLISMVAWLYLGLTMKTEQNQ